MPTDPVFWFSNFAFLSEIKPHFKPKRLSHQPPYINIDIVIAV